MRGVVDSEIHEKLTVDGISFLSRSSLARHLIVIFILTVAQKKYK